MARTRIPPDLQDWIDARKRHHLKRFARERPEVVRAARKQARRRARTAAAAGTTSTSPNRSPADVS